MYHVMKSLLAHHSRNSILATGCTFRGLNPGKVRDFFLLLNVERRVWDHPTSCSLCTGFFSLGKGCRGLKLNNPLPLVPRLRMGGDKFLQPLYSFSVCRQKTLAYAYK